MRARIYTQNKYPHARAQTHETNTNTRLHKHTKQIPTRACTNTQNKYPHALAQTHKTNTHTRAHKHTKQMRTIFLYTSVYLRSMNISERITYTAEITRQHVYAFNIWQMPKPLLTMMNSALVELIRPLRSHSNH